MIHALDGCGDFLEVPFDIVPDQLSNCLSTSVRVQMVVKF